MKVTTSVTPKNNKKQPVRVLPKFEKCTFEQFKEVVLNRIEKGELKINLPEKEMEEFKASPEAFIREWYENIVIPTRATKGSAGFDFVTPIPVLVTDTPVRIPTGIKCKMQFDKYLSLKSRSSLFGSADKMILVDGTIDADYYGNKKTHGIIFVQALTMRPDRQAVTFSAGEKICQGIIMGFYKSENENENPVNKVRVGGFGSTNKAKGESAESDKVDLSKGTPAPDNKYTLSGKKLPEWKAGDGHKGKKKDSKSFKRK